MCGYIGNTTDSPLTQALMDTLGISAQQAQLRNNPGAGPASDLDIIIHSTDGPKVVPAIWWLLLERAADGNLKPSRYTSFNSRSDRLEQSKSAAFKPYRQSRCIVPASYIIEGEGAKSQRRYHKIEPSQTSFALAGIYKEWHNAQSGELKRSFSVITLPPHPQWQSIHSKSTPLMLPPHNQALIAQWLDPKCQDVKQFQSLLVPKFHDQLKCTPIERPGHQRILGEPSFIQPDL